MNEVYKTNFSLQQKVFATNLSQNLLPQQSEEQNITNQVWCQTFINNTMLFGEPKAVNMIFKTTLIIDVTNFVVPLCNSFTHIRQGLLSFNNDANHVPEEKMLACILDQFYDLHVNNQSHLSSSLLSLIKQHFYLNTLIKITKERHHKTCFFWHLQKTSTEPYHEKTCFFHLQKQRHRSAER